MDIRKVEEKEMKIHSRDGPKLKRRKKERSYLKKPKLSVVSGLRRVRANSEASIKLRDHALYTLGRARNKVAYHESTSYHRKCVNVKRNFRQSCNS